MLKCALFRLINFVLFDLVLCVCFTFECRTDQFISLFETIYYSFFLFIYLFYHVMGVNFICQKIRAAIGLVHFVNILRVTESIFVHVSIMSFFGASKQKNRSSKLKIATPEFLIFGLQILDSDLCE